MAFYSYLSTKIIIAFITKSYKDLFGVRSYINAKIKDAYLYVGDAHFFILENKVVSTISSLISFVKENNRIPL